MAEDTEDWRNVEVNIAVIGKAGSGKSTYINSFRNLTHRDRDNPECNYAKVHHMSSEGTTKAVCYRVAGHSNLQIWDLPGSGTLNFPMDSYADDQNLKLFDAFVMLSKDRFNEIDSDMAKKIAATGAPCYFAHSRTDINIRQFLQEIEDDTVEQKAEQLERFTEEVRASCLEALKSGKSGSDCPDWTKDIFLIGQDYGGDVGGWRSDHDKLRREILEGLSGLKRRALEHGIFPSTTEQVDATVKRLAMWKFAATMVSGATRAASVPGAAMIDAVLARVFIFQMMKALAIDEESLAIRMMGYKGKMWTKEAILEEVRREGGEEHETLSAWIPMNNGTTLPSCLLASVLSAATTYNGLSGILHTNRKIAYGIIRLKAKLEKPPTAVVYLFTRNVQMDGAIAKVVASKIQCPDSYKHWALVVEYLDDNGEVNTTELYEAGNSDIYNKDGLGLLVANWIQIPRGGERERGKGLFAAIEQRRHEQGLNTSYSHLGKPCETRLEQESAITFCQRANESKVKYGNTDENCQKFVEDFLKILEGGVLMLPLYNARDSILGQIIGQ